MDKSPWDSQKATSILYVLQVLSQKAVLSFYKSMSPPPSPPNTMLKDQRNCALTVSTLSVGWGEGVGTYSASSARVQFRVCQKAFELYNSPKTFVHDCSFSFFKYPIKPYFFILYFFNLVPRALFPGFGGGGKAPWGRAWPYSRTRHFASSPPRLFKKRENPLERGVFRKSYPILRNQSV